MGDDRTLRQKLRDMANHPRSNPNEAEAARAKLRTMGPEPARQRPARSAGPFVSWWATGANEAGDLSDDPYGSPPRWAPPDKPPQPAPPPDGDEFRRRMWAAGVEIARERMAGRPPYAKSYGNTTSGATSQNFRAWVDLDGKVHVDEL